MASRLIKNLGLPIIGFLFGLAFWSISFETSYDQHYTAQPQHQPPHTRQESQTPLWTSWDKIDTIFAFGDSNTETHFDPLGTLPTPQHPFGNSARRPHSTPATSTNIWLEHLATRATNANLRIFNLARNNATTERYAYYTHNAGVLRAPQDVTHSFVEETTLNEQVDHFLTYFAHNPLRPSKPVLANFSSASTLAVSWVGMADIDESVRRGAEIAIAPLIASYASSLERLYDAGIRNFLILNIGPMQRVMADPYGFVARYIKAYNAGLRHVQRKMLRRHGDVTIFVFDTYGLFNRAIEHREEYPLLSKTVYLDRVCDAYTLGGGDTEDARRICGGGPEKYFWLSHVNVSAPVHELLADEVKKGCLGVKTGDWCDATASKERWRGLDV